MPSAAIEVVDDTGPVAAGPFGTVTDRSPDGGNWSTQGYVSATSLPAEAEVVPTDGIASHAVTFAYHLDDGAVIHSAVPLDFYLANQGSVSLNVAMQDYAANLLAAFTDGGNIFG